MKESKELLKEEIWDRWGGRHSSSENWSIFSGIGESLIDCVFETPTLFEDSVFWNEKNLKEWKQ